MVGQPILLERHGNLLQTVNEISRKDEVDAKDVVLGLLLLHLLVLACFVYFSSMSTTQTMQTEGRGAYFPSQSIKCYPEASKN